jgi:polyphosphate kinase
MKKQSQLLRLAAAIIGGILGFAIVSNIYEAGRNKSRLDFALIQVANDMNKKLPQMVDEQTRLDKVTAGSGKLTYFFSLPDSVKSNLDLADFENKLQPKAIENYKTNSTMNTLREQKVILDYEYKDKNGEIVFKTSISPKDF